MKNSNVIRYSFLAVATAMLIGCGSDTTHDDPKPAPTPPPPEYIDVNFEKTILGHKRAEIVPLKSKTAVSSISISQLPTLPEPFSVVEDGCSNKTVSFTSSCSFTIQFAPTAEGSFSHSFDVPSDANNTVTVRIKGTAAAESTGTPNPQQPPTSAIPVIGSRAQGAAFDSSGNLYISTESGKVAKLEAGNLSTFIPAGGAGMFFGKHIRYSQGNFYVQNTLNPGTNRGDGVDTVLLFAGTGGFIREIVRENPASLADFFEGIAVDAQGQLFVIVRTPLLDNYVGRADADGSNFKSIVASGMGQVYVPTSLAVDSKGNLYVGDPGVVSKFDSNGNFIQTIVSDDKPGSSGFEFASDLAVDSADNLYVGNAKGVSTGTITWNVLKFNSDGVFEREFIASGTGGLSSTPGDMSIDAQGALYIVDSFSESIAGVAKFTAEGSLDRIVAKNFTAGSAAIRSLQSATSAEALQAYYHELDLKAKALAKESSQ